MALSSNGFMRRWPTGGAGAKVDISALDIDAAPDGSVMVLGDGIMRIRPDGGVQKLIASAVLRSAHSIAALPDGGVVVSQATESVNATSTDVARQAVMELDASGGIVRRLRLPVSVGAVAALPDRALALAQERRVLHVDHDHRITVLAGGGRGFKDGAIATDVDLGHVSAIARSADDSLVIGSERGVLRLDREGRIHTLVSGGAQAVDFATDDPRAVNDDGRYARDVRLTEIAEVGTADGRQPLVLTAVPGAEDMQRLALIAPIDGVDRLAVALPRRNRTLLRRGRVDIIATGPATAHIELLRGRRVQVSRTIVLVRGRTRIRLRAPASSETHVLRVVARSPQGAIASHQLTVVPSRTISQRVVNRVGEAISLLAAGAETDGSVTCRRRTRTRFACTFETTSTTSRGVLRVRDDGLITFRRPAGRGVYALNLVFEPLTFDPRSN